MSIKILIIKLGYSETLDQDVGIIPSLGDVLRTTPLLRGLKEKYPQSDITWLVSSEAMPLLKGNGLINRILVWDSFVPFQLMREKFDVLVNLEKIPGVCALADMIDAWIKYGFRFESIDGTYHGYEKGLDFIRYIERKKEYRTRDFWQKILIEMLGISWKEQEYSIGYVARSKPKFDVGLNYLVGSKWPTKAMTKQAWERLADMLMDKGYSVSWQKGEKDLKEYFEWINSCRLIISQDSLGIHVALAYKKSVIGLFGPTDHQEICVYNRGEAIYSKTSCTLMPCYSSQCRTKMFCMENIDMREIIAAVKKLLKR